MQPWGLWKFFTTKPSLLEGSTSGLDPQGSASLPGTPPNGPALLAGDEALSLADSRRSRSLESPRPAGPRVLQDMDEVKRHRERAVRYVDEWLHYGEDQVYALLSSYNWDENFVLEKHCWGQRGASPPAVKREKSTEMLVCSGNACVLDTSLLGPAGYMTFGKAWERLMRGPL